MDSLGAGDVLDRLDDVAEVYTVVDEDNEVVAVPHVQGLLHFTLVFPSAFLFDRLREIPPAHA